MHTFLLIVGVPQGPYPSDYAPTTIRNYWKEVSHSDLCKLTGTKKVCTSKKSKRMEEECPLRQVARTDSLASKQRCSRFTVHCSLSAPLLGLPSFQLPRTAVRLSSSNASRALITKSKEVPICTIRKRE